MKKTLTFFALAITKQIRKCILFLIIAFIISSCSEMFDPDLRGAATPKYVVDGQIIDQEGYQTIKVSLTSPVKISEYTPLSNCEVKVVDNLENEFTFSEIPTEKGTYRAWFDHQYLVPGNSYQVKIKTQSGVQIESDFDQMPQGPEIDSIYYRKKIIPTTNPDKNLEGLQFYIDLKKGVNDSKYYRWELIESWEHHAVYPRTIYFNEKGKIVVEGPNYSQFYCYSTQPVQNVFTFKVENPDVSEFKLNQLHLVDNQTQRLTYCYSFLVNQHAISEPAYIYWDKLRKSLNVQGGLYTTQPIRIKGNLKCTSNPSLDILGFFGASSTKSKRIFVQHLEDFDFLYPECIPPHLPGADEKFKYMIEESGKYLVLEDGCVECWREGGNTIKPDYWPN